MHSAQADVIRALADLAEAARLAPSDPLIARRHAAALHRARKHNRADDEYSRALRLEPNPEVWLERCALRLEMQRHEDAVADCETAHATDPSERSTRLLAGAYLASGRRDSALLVLRDAAASRLHSKAIRGMLTKLERNASNQVPAANASRR